jgi:ribonuclease P protein component
VPGASPVGRFPKAQRIRKRREFEVVQKTGRRVTTPHFVLLLYARGESGPTRLGIVASRKVGTAVRRNRAKRLVREAFRGTRDLFQSGIDLVVIVRTSLDRMKLDDVAGELRRVSAAVDKRTLEAQSDASRRSEADSAPRGNRVAP